MTKKDLVKIIREVVKREVKSQIDTVLTEMEHKPNNKTSLNEVLNETTPFRTLKTFDAKDARAGFASMQDGASHTDLQGKPVNVEELPQELSKALTRDYTKIVQRFNK